MYREEMCFRKRDFSLELPGEFNFLEIDGKKKLVDLFLYNIITRWTRCFGLRGTFLR